ncbi:hypothetical protein V6N13_029732 [Hibiscus sabdariffa]
MAENTTEEAIGEGGNNVVLDVDLDSTLNRDTYINLNSNSANCLPSTFDENLTIVPIVETDTIPVPSIVPHVLHCPLEVVVSGGVSRKVRSVNDLILNTLSEEQRTVV